MFVTFAFLAATLAPPFTPSSAQAATVVDQGVPQSVTIAGQYTNTASRDGYTISEPAPVKVAATAPAVGVPDPGTAQAIAYGILQSMGMGDDQYACLVALWDRESGWNVYAMNSGSGAYGIPQALPGDKMASAGADWATNPATQITWGLQYITDRYVNPCGAWQHSEDAGWY